MRVNTGVRWLCLAAAVIVCIVPPAFAARDDAASTSRTSDMSAEKIGTSKTADVQANGQLQSAAPLMGASVRDQSGKSVGEVKDIVMDNSTNSVSSVLVSHGGFLGIGEKTISVPWKDINAEQAQEGKKGNVTLASAIDSYSKTPKLSSTQSKFSKIDGMEVRGRQDKEVGVIRDVLIDSEQGAVAYGIISIGDGRNQRSAVPWSAIKVSPNRSVASLDASRESLLATSFLKGQMPDFSDRSYAARLHDRYQATPYWETYGYAGEADKEMGKEAGRRISGQVISIGSYQTQNKESALRLRIKTDRGESVTVYGGPTEAFQEKGMVLRTGDQVEVSGRQIESNGRGVLLAERIQKGRTTLDVQADKARPAADTKMDMSDEKSGTTGETSRYQQYKNGGSARETSPSERAWGSLYNSESRDSQRGAEARNHLQTYESPQPHNNMSMARGREDFDAEMSHPQHGVSERAQLHQSSDLSGAKLVDRRGETIGEVKDLMIDQRNGRVMYVLVDLKKVEGVDKPMAALPWEALQIQSDKKQVRFVGNEQSLRSVAFSRNDKPDFASSAFGQRIHREMGMDDIWQSYGYGPASSDDQPMIKEQKNYPAGGGAGGGSGGGSGGGTGGSGGTGSGTGTGGTGTGTGVRPGGTRTGPSGTRDGGTTPGIGASREGTTPGIGASRDGTTGPGGLREGTTGPGGLREGTGTRDDFSTHGFMGEDRLSPSWRSDSDFNRAFRQDQLSNSKGTIVGISRFSPGEGDISGVRLRVRGEDGRVSTVFTGPQSFADRENMRFRLGDEINVRGSRGTFGDREGIFASEIRSGDKTFRFRDEQGRPRWDTSSTLAPREMQPGERVR